MNGITTQQYMTMTNADRCTWDGAKEDIKHLGDCTADYLTEAAKIELRKARRTVGRLFNKYNFNKGA